MKNLSITSQEVFNYSNKQTDFTHKAEKSPVEQTVSEIATAFEQSNNEFFETHQLGRNVGLNTIYGYLSGCNNGPTLGEMPADYVDYLLGNHLKQVIKNMDAFLPHHVRCLLSGYSSLPPQSRALIGLLRTPNIDETKIINRDYNFAMSQEAVSLGEHLLNKVNNNERPSFESMWNACKHWRMNRLYSHTDFYDVTMFGSERTTLEDIYGEKLLFRTEIHTGDARYDYILKKLVNQVKSNNKHVHYTRSNWNGQIIYRVQLQHHVVLKGQNIALTTLRTVLNQKGESIIHPWSHTDNKAHDLLDSDLLDVDLDDTPNGIMIHTDTVHHPVLKEAITEKFNTYLDRADTSNHSEQYKEKIFQSLGDIHYLLTQTAIDFRGSAAKSELFIRALAIFAGFELGPFKKGFVPDLEAFLNTHEDFSKRYIMAFE